MVERQGPILVISWGLPIARYLCTATEKLPFEKAVPETVDTKNPDTSRDSDLFVLFFLMSTRSHLSVHLSTTKIRFYQQHINKSDRDKTVYKTNEAE